MKMKPVHAALALALGALALGGCDRAQTQAAADKTQQALDKAGARTKAALEQAGEKAKELGNRVEKSDALERAGEKAKEIGTQVEKSAEEAAITAKVKGELLKDPELSALAINVDTEGSVVTLKGNAPNEKAARRAQRIAIATEGVTQVRNELATGG